jgi:tripartite-type tricarboxylate transporter receptor subunit TctC
MTGLAIDHVPFQGTGAAIPAVISNQVGAMWGFLPGLLPHIRGGTLKALAVGGRQRSVTLPDVPTVAEAGVPGYEASSWIGLLAPAGTPAPSMTKLWSAVNAAMQEPSVREVLARDGSDIVASTPEQFGRVIAEDDAKYAKLSGLFAVAK